MAEDQPRIADLPDASSDIHTASPPEGAVVTEAAVPQKPPSTWKIIGSLVSGYFDDH